jgi:hypothetical protein
MAGSSNNPPSQPNQKPYGVTNIKAYVPLILDLNELNYDAWRELFLTHCRGFGVLDFLNGKSLPTNADDEEWHTLDAIVKSWIYGTLTQPLLTMILKTDSTSKSVWDSLESLFRDNKHARSVELENELRSMVLGDLTISQYCSKFKAISDLLANIGTAIPENSLVTLLLKGLSPKFDQVSLLLRYKDPPPLSSRRDLLSYLKNNGRPAPVPFNRSIRTTPPHPTHSTQVPATATTITAASTGASTTVAAEAGAAATSLRCLGMLTRCPGSSTQRRKHPGRCALIHTNSADTFQHSQTDSLVLPRGILYQQISSRKPPIWLPLRIQTSLLLGLGSLLQTRINRPTLHRRSIQ